MTDVFCKHRMAGLYAAESKIAYARHISAIGRMP